MRNLFFISRLKRPAVCLFFILFIAFIPNSYSQVNQEYEYNSSYECNMNICYAFVNYSEDIILELDCGRAYSTANLDVNKYVGPIEVYASSIRLLEDTMVDCNSFFKSNAAIQSNEIPIEDIKYEIDKYDDIFVSAEDIQTLSTYNWYDSEGHFIHAGKDMQISNAIAKKYRVEVIDTEGFVSYKDVELVLKPNRLELLYPNPISHETLNVQYKINKANSGYLMILSYYATTGIANNYIVDINSNEKNIELNNYPSGLYKVVLVIDGKIEDVKILSKH